MFFRLLTWMYPRSTANDPKKNGSALIWRNYGIQIEHNFQQPAGKSRCEKEREQIFNRFTDPILDNLFLYLFSVFFHYLVWVGGESAKSCIPNQGEFVGKLRVPVAAFSPPLTARPKSTAGQSFEF